MHFFWIFAHILRSFIDFMPIFNILTPFLKQWAIENPATEIKSSALEANPVATSKHELAETTLTHRWPAALKRST
ncbi:hypothetical protein KT71_04260 [Congregibacter litoralis KT71]|uniref:Uncharacterized protein n=2 Tax=Congregibacter TaxID=393661 RepID=A4A8U9_9GAMM|nr:hypothetical protein KT71_04260 [Congregibacter litoralis KT71]